MAVVVNDILQARIVCSTDEQVGINVKYFEVTAIGGAGLSETQIASGLSGLLAPLYKPLLSDNATFNGVSVQRVDPLPKTVAGVSTNGTGAGTAVGDMLPTQCSGLISLRTSFAGKKFRGRMYIPFPSEISNADDSKPVAAYIAALGLIGDEFIKTQTFVDGADQATVNPIIWNATDRQPYSIVGYTAKNRWATQRRRGGFGQQNQPPF